ncbi:MAG: hypothetical protein ACRCUY_11935 [Thermoguttaceae bacterium]
MNTARSYRPELHNAVDLLPEVDVKRVLIMVSALIDDSAVPDAEREEIDDGFAQIASGDCISGSDYMARRGLLANAGGR